MEQIQDARVLDDHPLNLSEHHPVFCALKINNPCFKNYTTNSRLSWKRAIKLNTIPQYQASLGELLGNLSLPDLDNNCLADIEAYYNDIVYCLQIAASENIPMQKYSKALKPYWTEELNNVHNVMTLKRMLWINEEKPRGVQYLSYVEYKKAKTEFRCKLRATFNDYIANEIKEIDQSAEVNQNIFWTLYKKKKHNNNFQQEIKYNGMNCTTNEDVANAWSLHFEGIFSDSNSNNYNDEFKEAIEDRLKHIETNASAYQELYLENPVSSEEIHTICRGLKDDKAGGYDKITYEHLKYGCKALFDHLANIINLIIKHEYIPSDWKHGVIVTIYKGNSKPKTDPNSYRGITLLSVIFKVFEMIMSNRLSEVLESKTFPCKQQMAYQKSLSSLHASFNLQECIHYNNEHGEQVHVAFLDSAKAFDTVWHDGLLVKLYEVDIRGKAWILFRNIYRDMKSCVFVNGTYSKWFDVKRGIRQGSALSAKLYLVFINSLLENISKSKLGSAIVDLTVNIPTQADDICLISNTVSDLQKMVEVAENYSNIWRFQFSATKSSIVTFQPRKDNKLINANPVVLYSKEIPRVVEVTHVGVLLNQKWQSVDRTLNACKKLKASTMSLIRSGVHPAALNPLTNSRLVLQIGYAKALYGCELWSLSRTEYMMLERTHRFVLKSIQGFDKRTRSDMCTGTMGWTTIEAMIDTKKLLFLGNLCRLRYNSLPKRVLITRLYMYLFDPRGQYGFVPNVMAILDKLNLRSYVIEFIKNGYFPSKNEWKKIVKSKVQQEEEESWKDRMSGDDDFAVFKNIQTQLKPHVLWKLAVQKPEYREHCNFIVKLCVTIRTSEEQKLCEKCGLFYAHLVTACATTETVRDIFWCYLINNFDVQFSVYIHGLTDEEMLYLLLGGHIEHNLQKNEEEQFRLKACTCLYIIVQKHIININVLHNNNVFRIEYHIEIWTL